MNRQLPVPDQQQAGSASPVNRLSRSPEKTRMLPSVPAGGSSRKSDNAESPRSVAPINVAPALAERQGLSWLAVLTWSWVVGSVLFSAGQACAQSSPAETAAWCPPGYPHYPPHGRRDCPTARSMVDARGFDGVCSSVADGLVAGRQAPPGSSRRAVRTARRGSPGGDCRS